MVERILAGRDRPVHIRKQIVHNTHVIRDLQRRGAVFVDELDEAADRATVVFSPHGVSPAVQAEARRRGLRTIDATCLPVTKVHDEALCHATTNRQDALPAVVDAVAEQLLLVAGMAVLRRLRPGD